MVERKELTMSQLGVVTALALTIGFRNNILRNPDTGFPLTIKEMAEYLGLNYDYLRKDILPILEGKGIILREGKYFILNPDIAWKGKTSDNQWLETKGKFISIRRDNSKSQNSAFPRD